MLELIKEHWLLSVLVTIFLGAVGSGLWDWILRPAFHKLGILLFFLFTFGTKKASDIIYRQAAMGHHELASLVILFIIIGTIVGSVFSTQAVRYMAINSAESSRTISEECVAIEDSSEKTSCNIRQIKNRLVAKLPYTVLLGIVIIIIEMYKFISINRINLVVTYFNQCFRACMLYMDKEKILEIKSRVALMEDKNDYNKIIYELQQIAERHNIILPKSYVW